jgi:hypothetical protein
VNYSIRAPNHFHAFGLLHLGIRFHATFIMPESDFSWFDSTIFRGGKRNTQSEATMPLFETEPPIKVPTPREVTERLKVEREQARQQEEEWDLPAELWIDLGGEG